MFEKQQYPDYITAKAFHNVHLQGSPPNPKPNVPTVITFNKDLNNTLVINNKKVT